MLRRIYIDNFKAFVNFEQKFDRRNLILGANCSGKSSLLDALYKLRQFLARGDRTEDLFFLHEKTRWTTQTKQTWEVEAELEGHAFIYRLVLEPWGDPVTLRVLEETVRCDGSPLFEFLEGEVHLFNDRFERKVTYPFDWHRSALATVQARKENTILTIFRQAVPQLLFFRLNPFAMETRAESEDVAPRADLTNFASWYRHLVQTYPKQTNEFLTSLKTALDGFEFLRFNLAGENAKALVAEFRIAGVSTPFGFAQLSDGQRSIICLYALLHFVLATGCTVFIDEPDNFVSLREIQPWLTAAEEALEQGHGQLIIVSHHPELLDQWAPEYGIQFFREEGGPVRSRPFSSIASGVLSPSELIARGWERE